MSIFLERLQLKKKNSKRGGILGWKLCFSVEKVYFDCFHSSSVKCFLPLASFLDKSCVRCREQEWKDQNQTKNYTDVKSAKDSSRSLRFLILLGCERTANQFKEGALGCKACSASLAARLRSSGASHGVGLEMGRRWWQCSSGVGEEAVSDIEADERVGAGRSNSEPE